MTTNSATSAPSSSHPGGVRVEPARPTTERDDPEPDAARGPQRPRGLRGRVVSTLIGLVQFTLVAGLIGSGVFAAWWFNRAQPVAEGQAAADDEAARPVIVETARRADVRVAVQAMGTVRPARQAVIRPRVSGMLVEQSPAFVPGGFFDEGEFMVQIDRADYEQTLEQRRSALEQAEADLQIELGDQAVAEEELELLKVNIPEINRDLILRIPQVNRAKAQVRSAEAAVARAELDLDRTRVRAPFAGQLVERAVTEGNNISAGDNLATLVGTGTYLVELAVPVSALSWIRGPDDPPVEPAGDAADPDDTASPVTIRYPAAWGERASRRGRVARKIGRLEPSSRLARVLVEVPDPLALDADEPRTPRLILGAYVDAKVHGRRVADAVVIDRDLIREQDDGGDAVWVMDDNDRLDIRPVELAYAGPRQAYVTRGLDDGDRIVRTNLTTPVEGMLLRIARPKGEPDDDPDAADPRADTQRNRPAERPAATPDVGGDNTHDKENDNANNNRATDSGGPRGGRDNG